MKTLSRYIVSVILILCITAVNKNVKAQNSSVSFQIFYDNLAPYGSWVSYSNYGYAWIPDIGPDFSPYSTNGYWVYTEYGWTWVSEYSWGWAPFHYGRWVFDSFYGWVWVPGDQWGPAWVVWRSTPGYYGWAPIPPGVSINIVLGGTYQPANEYWVFVDEHYIGRHDISSYYGPRKNNTLLIEKSRVIDNTREDKERKTTYIPGPEKSEVQRITGKNIEDVSVKETTKPTQSVKNNQFNLYRPAVTKTIKATPSRIADNTEIKPISERKVSPKAKEQIPDQKADQNNKPEKKPVLKNEREIIPPKEVTPPVKDKPQPVVPDNTRTKKQEPISVPKPVEKIEKPKSERPIEPQPHEKREPVLTPEKHAPSRKDVPENKPKMKSAPAPSRMPDQKQAPKEIPHQQKQRPPKK
jgi:hypothetical protein